MQPEAGSKPEAGSPRYIGSPVLQRFRDPFVNKPEKGRNISVQGDEPCVMIFIMVLSAKVRYPGIGIFMGLKPQNNISFSKSTEINYLYTSNSQVLN